MKKTRKTTAEKKNDTEKKDTKEDKNVNKKRPKTKAVKQTRRLRRTTRKVKRKIRWGKIKSRAAIAQGKNRKYIFQETV